MTKKILIFSTAYLPLIGGAEIAVKEITDRLSACNALPASNASRSEAGWRSNAGRSNYEFDLICARIDRKLSREEKIGRINVYRVGSGSNLDKIFFPITGFLKASFLYSRLCSFTPKFGAKGQRLGYDAIWAIMASYGGLAALFFKFFHPKIPFLLTLQEGDAPEYIRKRMKPFFLFKMIFKKADYIQAISNFLAEWGRQMGAKCPIEVVHNGVDLEKFKKIFSDAEKQELKEKLNIQENEKIIITVSRLVPKNGIGDLIGAMQYLNHPFKLLIIGDGFLKEKLEQQTKRIKLEDKILFLGKIDNEKIPLYLSISNVFVRPSLSEGLGNVFLEAKAARAPVIGTPVGGIPEIITNNFNGLFCEVKNPKSIAEKINLVFNDDNLKKSLIAWGLKMIDEEKYNWDYIAGRMADIFKDIEVINNITKILITTGIFPPDIGGPATQIDAFCRELIKRDFKVTILTFGSQTHLEADYPYKVIKISHKIFQPLKNIIFGFKVFQLALKNDLIYAEDLYAAGFFSFLVSKILRKKMILRFAGDSAWEAAQLKYNIKDNILSFQKKKYKWQIELKKWLRKLILVNSAKIIAVSNFMKNLAINIGVSEEKIKVIYNSIDFQKRERISDLDKLKKDLNLNQGPILITAGRLVPWKNIDIFFYLMPAFLRKYGAINFLIIGIGPEENNLKNLTKELKIEKFVRFLGKVPQEKMLNYFSLADIFVLNTNYEGLSHTILEAMAAGLPVVSTNIGGNPEVIEDGKNGFLVGYNNREQWFESVSKLLDDFDLRKRFIEEGGKSLNKFNWQKLIDETTNVFKECLINQKNENSTY